MANEFERNVIYLLAIRISSSVKCPSMSFARILIVFFLFFQCWILRFLYMF